MYINKPSVTKIEERKKPSGLILCIALAAGLNSTNPENLVKCLYFFLDMRHFMIVTKTTLSSDIEIKH